MNNQRGATLVELLIYIGIVGMILTTISMFLLNLLNTRIKTSAISEVVANGRIVQDYLHDTIRHAEGINTGTSVFDVDPGVLSVDMVDVASDPIVFSLTSDNGQFQVNKAGSGNIVLTSDAIQVTNLVFTDLTSTEDVGIILVEFTVSTVNQSSSNEYDYEESFQTTLRIPLDQE